VIHPVPLPRSRTPAESTSSGKGAFFLGIENESPRMTKASRMFFRHKERHRTVDPSLAKLVAYQLMAHDALGAHARDELGITETLRARPIQAAFASALSFAVGAAMPLLTSTFAPERSLIMLVPGTSLLFLALLGALAAGAGGAGLAVGAIRVMFWGALAMGLTAGVGALFGTVV
jgi:vacuolar iron transporter family protein